MSQRITSGVSVSTLAADEVTDRPTAASLDRLIAALPDAVDQSMRNAIPHLYTPEKAAEFTAAMITELRARYATRSGEPAAPIRAMAGQILTQCCQRRPDRDPATGDLLSDVEDTDETSLDRLLCVEDHGHDGDHRDFMRRTWPRQEMTV